MASLHPPTNQPSPRTDALTALVLLAVGIVFITLYPFGFVRTQAVFVEQLKHAAQDPFDLLLPLHALPAIVAMWLAMALAPRRKAMVLAVLIAAFLVALELVQVGIKYRHARLGDVIVQWIGLGLGIWTFPLVARMLRPLTRYWRVLWALLLIAQIWAASTVVITGQLGRNIAGWDESFPFMLGDEYKGHRPWSGVIHSAGVYAGSTSSPELGDFQHSMIYDLTKGPQSIGTIDFDLRTWKIVYSDLGLDLDAGRYAQGPRPASEIVKAIMQAGAATIEIQCTPTLRHQTGPARILTISKGLQVRNITIAQDGDALLLRVRTPRSGLNGAEFESAWAGVFEEGKRVHLVATTIGGRSRLWVDGVDRGEREQISSLGDWFKVKGAGKDWIAGIVLFAPLGLLTMRLGRKRIGRGILTGLAGGICVLAALGTAQWMHRPAPIGAVLVALACIILGLIAGWCIHRCTMALQEPKIDSLQ